MTSKPTVRLGLGVLLVLTGLIGGAVVLGALDIDSEEQTQGSTSDPVMFHPDDPGVTMYPTDAQSHEDARVHSTQVQQAFAEQWNDRRIAADEEPVHIDQALTSVARTSSADLSADRGQTLPTAHHDRYTAVDVSCDEIESVVWHDTLVGETAEGDQWPISNNHVAAEMLSQLMDSDQREPLLDAADVAGIGVTLEPRTDAAGATVIDAYAIIDLCTGYSTANR